MNKNPTPRISRATTAEVCTHRSSMAHSRRLWPVLVASLTAFLLVFGAGFPREASGTAWAAASGPGGGPAPGAPEFKFCTVTLTLLSLTVHGANYPTANTWVVRTITNVAPVQTQTDPIFAQVGETVEVNQVVATETYREDVFPVSVNLSAVVFEDEGLTGFITGISILGNVGRPIPRPPIQFELPCPITVHEVLFVGSLRAGDRDYTVSLFYRIDVIGPS